MRWILSISAALGLAAVSSGVGGAQAPDKFTLTCPLPFDPISVHRPLDTNCENEGRPLPADGAVEANKEQNRAKNNFCAGGAPVMVTKKTFKDLEAKAEALEQATAGSAHPLPSGATTWCRRIAPPFGRSGSIRRQTVRTSTKARRCKRWRS